MLPANIDASELAGMLKLTQIMGHGMCTAANIIAHLVDGRTISVPLVWSI